MKVKQVALCEIRGWRNNNPGNLRHGNRWEGLLAVQADPDFCQFYSPEFGIRAMSRTLSTYYNKHGLRTIHSIINRWAPPNENDTDAYIRSVSLRLGISADQTLRMGIDGIKQKLIKAVIHHELGCQPYGDWLIDIGIVWDKEGIPKGVLH